MSDIRCAWESISRLFGCQGKATGFLRTAKGTIWPLCESCCQAHKTLGMKLVHNGSLEVNTVVKADFDIPLDDTATLTAFQAQDPSLTTITGTTLLGVGEA